MQDNMSAIELKKFIKSCGAEKEQFLLGNKVLMAIVQICVDKHTKSPDKTIPYGATSEEVLGMINSFVIKDKDFNTKKKSFDQSDMKDICDQVFELNTSGLIEINQLEVIPTQKGLVVGLINFNMIKPLQHSVVYEYVAEIEKLAEERSNLMRN